MQIKFIVISLIIGLAVGELVYLKNTAYKPASMQVAPPTVTIPNEDEIVNQKYGQISDLTIRPSDWSYSFLASNPTLSKAEKDQIGGYIANNLTNMFETNINQSNNFISNHFKVKSFNLRPVYDGDISPPNRNDLRSVRLDVNYEFQFDWFKTTFFDPPDGNTGNITLGFNISDYKNNIFVPTTKILPSDMEEYLAFRNGIEKIISLDNAKKLIKQKMMEKLQFNNNVSYQQEIAIDNNQLKLLLTSSNFSQLCSGKIENFLGAIKEVNAMQCSVDLSSSETKCNSKKVPCAARM